jgi:hypothetical protein
VRLIVYAHRNSRRVLLGIGCFVVAFALCVQGILLLAARQ